jgi:DNA primase
MLCSASREYLHKRGYTDTLISNEGLFDIPKGEFKVRNISGWVENQSVGFPVRSPSGRLVAVATAGVGVREYKAFYDLEHIYAPVCFGTHEDFKLLWESGQTIVVEGLFDRIPVKRAFPDRCVLARLTKGLSPPMIRMFERMATRVWLAMDMDSPGEKASDTAEKKLKGPDVVRIMMPYKDPGKLYEVRGVDGVRAVFKKQIELMDF